jgi:hypothetical protein
MYRIRRRAAALLLATGLTLGLTTASALAMQPPGKGAQDRFGCVDGEDAAVAGHPGAAGLVAATPRVAELTGNAMPTAWNAVTRAEPIVLGSC